ncbi:MAG TPA: hypothetical protein VK400_06725, partial [Pyrinomonadaceae bacterium]|nr:hypothetical protein [Pyrinomonadaceae bacterium]
SSSRRLKMKDEHILDILDEKAFADFDEAEMGFIKAHAARCADCFQAFEAARISSVLLKTSAAEAFEPSPFFQTRVMANLRQKQAKINPFAALARLWKASASLVVMMMAMVAGLIALTIFAPQLNPASGSDSSAQVSTFDNYSTDMVIINDRLPGREPTNEQVFQIIYASSENGSRK